MTPFQRYSLMRHDGPSRRATYVRRPVMKHLEMTDFK
jgi:hypothetical protein